MDPHGNMSPSAYYIARDNLARDIKNGQAPQTAEGIAAYVQEAAGVPAGTAAWFSCRFLDDLQRDLERKRT